MLLIHALLSPVLLCFAAADSAHVMVINDEEEEENDDNNSWTSDSEGSVVSINSSHSSVFFVETESSTPLDSSSFMTDDTDDSLDESEDQSGH